MPNEWRSRWRLSYGFTYASPRKDALLWAQLDADSYEAFEPIMLFLEA